MLSMSLMWFICLSHHWTHLYILDNLYTKYYKSVIADHPGNVKRCGVCTYFKGSLPGRCLSNPYIKECFIKLIKHYSEETSTKHIWCNPYFIFWLSMLMSSSSPVNGNLLTLSWTFENIRLQELSNIYYSMIQQKFSLFHYINFLEFLNVYI